jgi:proline racemase
MPKFSTIDAHVAGETVRLLVGGAPSIAGRTMAEKFAWLRRHGEGLRRSLMLEPRGHAAMHGALFTEPVSPRAHAGLLSMHAGGFPQLSGESVIAAVTIALENKLIEGESEKLTLDTPVGLIRVRVMRGARGAGGATRVSGVTVTGVPSFVLSAGLSIQLGRRAVRVDVAFGGEFYAIVDSESIGIPVDPRHSTQLIAAAAEVAHAIESAVAVAHPVEKWKGIQGAIFTAPPRGAADLRSATVLCSEQGRTVDGGILRRSPGVTGTCALLAVLDAMGLVPGDQPFTHEGVIGTTLTARVLSRQMTDDTPFVLPVVEGSAWTTGRHEFELDENDPLKDGFAV